MTNRLPVYVRVGTGPEREVADIGDTTEIDAVLRLTAAALKDGLRDHAQAERQQGEAPANRAAKPDRNRAA